MLELRLPALPCALETVGVDHLLLGSDDPFALGSMAESIEAVKTLGLAPEDEERVFSGNLGRLLR